MAIPLDEHESRESILDRADHDMYDRKMFLKSNGLAVRSRPEAETEFATMERKSISRGRTSDVLVSMPPNQGSLAFAAMDASG